METRGHTLPTKKHDSKENKSVALVILVASALVVCFSPGVTCTVVALFVPDFLDQCDRSVDDGEILSDFALHIFIVINHVILSTCICLLGIVSNCINITVFTKQGLRRSVNLSLCAMSFSDLFGLFFQVWQNLCVNPYLELADFPVDFEQIQFLTAGCPNVLMVRITTWITMYVTFERCLSVLTPLKIHRLITFERTLVILCIISVLNLSCYLPLFTSAHITWNFYPDLNRTKVGITFVGDQVIVSSVMNNSLASLSIIAFGLVVILTGSLVVHLKRKSKWRRGATTFDADKDEVRNLKENKTVAMIILVASVLIVCLAPGVTCTILALTLSDFWIVGRKANLFHAVWSFCFLFQSINSSVNVLLYYRMSSKYRFTFKEIFPRMNNSVNARKIVAP
ncbi:hypothetical protein Btru_072371 [Bulinus truncatus]|nr:hypothetical protein Btru_072371 [Bulinus truncatus]